MWSRGGSADETYLFFPIAAEAKRLNGGGGGVHVHVVFVLAPPAETVDVGENPELA